MPLVIEVVTRNLSDPDEPPDIRRMDWHRYESRTWFEKHFYWAMTHNYSVTTSRIIRAKDKT